MVNVKPVKLGNSQRYSFGKIDDVIDMPNLIEVQKKSYQWFLDEGLKEVFKDVSGITDYQDNLVLDFIDYTLDVVDGKELYSQIEDYRFITGTLTLNYDDGTSKEFRLKMPPENPDEASASSLGKKDNELHVVLGFPEPVNAGKVISVELNEVEVFAE